VRVAPVLHSTFDPHAGPVPVGRTRGDVAGSGRRPLQELKERNTHMTSLNKVQLIGNLGRDPESRSAQSGSTIVTLNVATSEGWTDRNSGERREHTEWHRVVIFTEALGEAAARHLRKGSKVYIEGGLRTRKWRDQSGQDRYTTEIVLTPFNGKLVFLDRRERGDGEAPSSAPPANGAPDLDDEIPF
jgi:single-strand DNA-binding protein